MGAPGQPLPVGTALREGGWWACQQLMLPAGHLPQSPLFSSQRLNLPPSSALSFDLTSHIFCFPFDFGYQEAQH